MHSVGKASSGYFKEFNLKVFKLLLKVGKVINDEEHIAKGHILKLASLASCAQGHHRIDTRLAEEIHTLLDNGTDLTNKPPDFTAFGLIANTTDVRHLLQAAKLPAAKINAIELHLLRSMGDAKRGNKCLEEGTLPRLRSADNGKMPSSAREVQHQRLLLLHCGFIYHADGRLEQVRSDAVLASRRLQLISSVFLEHFTECEVRGQWWQPDLMNLSFLPLRLPGNQVLNDAIHLCM